MFVFPSVYSLSPLLFDPLLIVNVTFEFSLKKIALTNGILSGMRCTISLTLVPMETLIVIGVVVYKRIGCEILSFAGNDAKSLVLSVFSVMTLMTLLGSRVYSSQAPILRPILCDASFSNIPLKGCGLQKDVDEGAVA